MRTAAQILVSMLEVNRIDRVFCLPGESFLPVLDALLDSPIDTVTCRHESSAGFMAVADARLTGRPGICLVSRGPGATNASIAIHTAQQDALPLIVFIGQVARKNLRRDGFQEIDYGKMFGDVAKMVAEITDPGRMAEVLARAFDTAIGGTPGPVVISLPEDILAVPVEAPSPKAASRALTAPNRTGIGEVLALLRDSERPLIIAGRGLAAGRGRELLLETALRFSIPVLASFRRHDLFPNDHRLYAGDLGVGNSRKQLATFEEADLILAVGTRLGDLTTKGYTFPRSPWPRQRLVHVYDDSSVVGKHFRPDVGMICDPSSFLENLLAPNSGSEMPKRDAWIDRLHEINADLSVWRPRRAADGVVFGNVIAALAQHVRRDAIIVPDAGISAALLYRYFPFRPPQLLFATVTGCMGWGIPGAVTAALREPDRQIVCVAGDGGFMMTGNELALAVERRLSICVFLSNNRSLGTIRVNQEREFPGRPSATDLSGPDFAALARSFGCTTFVIDSEDAVSETVSAALGTKGVVFVEVKSSLSAALPASAQAQQRNA
ncbi:MAG: thiamine pyrophosphate-dependent enzyme [Acidobacteriota bacterium]